MELVTPLVWLFSLRIVTEVFEVLTSSREAFLVVCANALKHRARTLELLPPIKDGIVGLMSYSS